jgi:histidinol dehydrogenase
MEIIRYPQKDQWESIFRRPVFESESLEQTVKTVIENIRLKGDAALKEYTLKFDKAKIDDFLVSEKEMNDAGNEVTQELKNSIEVAIKNITLFHEAQKANEVRVETTPGVECWQKSIPISKVGLYIPGGNAPLFSTILMLAIPAVIAGCEEIILCSPPDSQGKLNSAILYTANRVGIRKVFKAGGAQAIAAMAYGTDSIPKVYKILGPGNQYVMTAKQLVARDAAAIDMPAGPSEVAVVADSSSNPVFVASDLLSQAEHGADSQVLLLTAEPSLIENVVSEIKKQIALLPKFDLASRSMANSKAILAKDKEEIMQMVNEYAPEHLIISTDDADVLAEKVINAGSVFIGHYTPESAGDYASGTNHTLPTHGWAKAYNGVNLDSFYRKVTFQKISRKGLEILGPSISAMALAEELKAHQQAVELRLGQKE